HPSPTLANHNHCHGSGGDTRHDNILGEKPQVPSLRFFWGRKTSSSETAQNHVSAPAGRPARNIAASPEHSGQPGTAHIYYLGDNRIKIFTPKNLNLLNALFNIKYVLQTGKRNETRKPSEGYIQWRIQDLGLGGAEVIKFLYRLDECQTSRLMQTKPI
ncbi:hypothetical protein AVEN_214050-1, partial [Araneus ventricosus]